MQATLYIVQRDIYNIKCTEMQGNGHQGMDI